MWQFKNFNKKWRRRSQRTSFVQYLPEQYEQYIIWVLRGVDFKNPARVGVGVLELGSGLGLGRASVRIRVRVRIEVCG